MRTILNNRFMLWVLLSVPAVLMLAAYGEGRADALDLLHPSGETSARLMILAMVLAPLADIIGRRAWLAWMIARRRYFGVAAFAYALLHLVFYMIDMGNIDDMLAEIAAPGIWTAWAAFAAMLPVALSSNDAAMRALGAGWKRVQRLVYPAALLTLLHWGYVHNGWQGALIHFAPLALLLGVRYSGFRLPNPQGA